MKILTLILSIGLFAMPGHATQKKVLNPKAINWIINNCRDIYGLPVDYVIHEDVQGGAYSTLHPMSASSYESKQGRYIPVVHISTEWFYFKSVPGQAFTLAHECGHQKLGHIAEGSGSKPGKEFAADCWAIYYLVKGKIISKKSEILEMEMDYYRMRQGVPGSRSETHPGTLERYDNINQCFDEAMSGKPMRTVF